MFLASVSLRGDTTAEERELGDKVTLHVRQLQKLVTKLEFQLDGLKRRYDKRPHRIPLPRLHPQLIKFLFPLCALWQCLVIVIITSVESSKRNWRDDQLAKSLIEALMILFQLLNFLFIITTSIKLLKQFLHHTASPLFLVQSYTSTTLLFAGIYTTFEMITKEDKMGDRAFAGMHYSDEKDETWTANVFGQLLFYSISSATLCGSSVVHPIQWYAYVVSGIQVIMSFLYFSAIMGNFMQEWKDNVNYKINHAQGTNTIKEHIHRMTETHVRKRHATARHPTGETSTQPNGVPRNIINQSSNEGYQSPVFTEESLQDSSGAGSISSMDIQVPKQSRQLSIKEQLLATGADDSLFYDDFDKLLDGDSNNSSNGVEELLILMKVDIQVMINLIQQK